jgi:hypothetical protein
MAKDKVKKAKIFVRPKKGYEVRHPDKPRVSISEDGMYVDAKDKRFARLVASGDLEILDEENLKQSGKVESGEGAQPVKEAAAKDVAVDKKKPR